ncbi:MAG: isoprenylcysteine carboxylmethyltransferase family protein [Nitrospirae bacterium]|nr:isoprenylcysteine carboxylmethyltransferase family protein [Nitrospirota bacterium]
MNKTKALFSSVIALYFVIALEVLIMISPFAGFFYSIFNPFLLETAKYPSTRWLSAFYLPHLVLTEDSFLQFVRVMGSLVLVLGAMIFLVCACQVYTAKFRRKGAVLAGLYAVVRHPQYLGLGLTGLGLSILWPRFLTVVLWLFMALVYYFLARDEERRMLKSHEDTYRKYMSKTGMFLPKAIEKTLTPESLAGKVMFALTLAATVMGAAFMLRAYTIGHLTIWTKAQDIVGVAILPEDGFKMDHRMADILNLKEVKERLQGSKQYLVYFIPRDYIMQGMIADTGGDWMLYKQHHAISMITDWVFHPFRHLREGHHAMHGNLHMHHQAQGMEDGVLRRLIFLSIENVKSNSPADFFAINTLRVPQFMADVDVHNMQLLDVRDLPHGSGWGSVPTPVF